MGWNKITIDTLTSAEDMISYELTELGATGVEVEDHVSLTEEEMKVMYVDLLPDDIAPDDGTAKISCYFDEEENLEAITMEIRQMLERLKEFMDIGPGTISFDKTKEEDWVNNWKKFFKPIQLDDQIVIKPTWETLENVKDNQIVVEIDPGTAFGTGSHETTKLCIEGMKPYIKEDTKILDVGCGSGILSIIGMKLGASHAVLTDIDPHAITATMENFEVNHLSKDCYDVYQGNILEDDDFAKSLGSKCYPVVVANILADVISPLIEIVDQFMTEDGVFVISGIIDSKEQEIADKLNTFGFEIVETRRMKDWVSMTAKKR
ncbi:MULTISPECIES: 50S ribosomal protein L11 methyltransferase [Anaerostipes]|uniref:50S ribosomal protein L11 methyltransferase n=1 Tax=Anaerostipes TaxID=207244 RepID=UPI001C1E0A58|nr:MULTISPECIES: 50S ribosomal protein L11 methyltransferase [Anaerostipes]MCI5623073.1 50S ribosomal protein L11 methyltransferase [Anaerostipes sp.]